METPSVEILQLVEGAKQASGLTVVIDVLRAFSVVCYAFAKGTQKIIPVGKVETAWALKTHNPTFALIGERHGRIIDGFDYGNSPSEIATADLRGKTLIHTTSNGTQGIVNAHNADEIITGSFVNAGAIVAYIKSRQPQMVSLVCMGSDDQPAIEDTLCAQYLRALILAQPMDFASVKHEIMASERIRPFLDPTVSFLHEADLEMCLTVDQFPFILQAIPTKIGDLDLHELNLLPAPQK